MCWKMRGEPRTYTHKTKDCLQDVYQTGKEVTTAADEHAKRSKVPVASEHIEEADHLDWHGPAVTPMYASLSTDGRKGFRCGFGEGTDRDSVSEPRDVGPCEGHPRL